MTKRQKLKRKMRNIAPYKTMSYAVKSFCGGDMEVLVQFSIKPKK